MARPSAFPPSDQAQLEHAVGVVLRSPFGDRAILQRRAARRFLQGLVGDDRRRSGLVEALAERRTASSPRALARLVLAFLRHSLEHELQPGGDDSKPDLPQVRRPVDGLARVVGERSAELDHLFPPAGGLAYLTGVALRAMACEAALGSWKGTSSQAVAVRHQVWTACFGRDLHHGGVAARSLRDVNVLVTGESGTGKELVCRAVLAGSPPLPDESHKAPTAWAPRHPQHTLNLAEIPEKLIRSELLGIRKGVASGVSESPGHLRDAHGGALFLDEVGDLPQDAQVALLRVAQQHEARRIGDPADQNYLADIRYVCATHRDLHAMTADGSFRADLFERLRGIELHLPPLRDRIEDVRDIAQELINDEEQRSGADAEARKEGRDAVMAWLTGEPIETWPWAGNVRELTRCVRRVFAGVPTPLRPPPPSAGAPHWPAPRQGGVQQCARELTRDSWGDGELATEAQLRDAYMHAVVDRCGGSTGKASELLDLAPSTLRRRLARAGRAP